MFLTNFQRLAPGIAISRLRLMITKLKSKKKPDMDGCAPAEPLKACQDDANDKKC